MKKYELGYATVEALQSLKDEGYVTRHQGRAVLLPALP